jgi:hypothetical protein
MRVVILTKDFGVIRTKEEPFDQQRFDDLTTQLEGIGDTCHEKNSFSIEDDKGNRVVLSPYILRQSIFIVER